MSHLATIADSLTPRERLRAGLMLASIVALHVIGFGVFILFVVPSHYKGLGIGVAVLAYSLGLRHAFDADHIAAIDNTTRKLITRASGRSASATSSRSGTRRSSSRSESGSSSPRRPSTGRSPTATRVSAVRRRLRNGRVGELPVRNRDAQPRHPRRHRPCVPRDAPRHLRRGRARASAPEPRPDEPLLRPVDALDQPRVADLPGRGRVRDGFRHRDRGRAARDDGAARDPAPAVLRDPLPADPVHGGHVSDGHARRDLHELRLRLGVLQPGPQGLLQPRDHGPVGRDLLLHRRDRGARSALERGERPGGGFSRSMAGFDINRRGS